jgi:hypothetical protein
MFPSFNQVQAQANAARPTVVRSGRKAPRLIAGDIGGGKMHQSRGGRPVWRKKKTTTLATKSMRQSIIDALQKEVANVQTTAATVEDYLRNSPMSASPDFDERRHTAPASPSRRLQLPLPPALPLAPPAPTSPQFSLLPDPMAEFESLERQYKETQKHEHSSRVVSNCIAIHRRHSLCLALSNWTLHTSYQQTQEMRLQKASTIILTALRLRTKRIAAERLSHANTVLQRNLLRIIMALKIISTYKKRQLVQKFVKEAVGPRFKTVIQTLRWNVIKIQRFIRSYLVCSRARLKLMRLKFDKRVIVVCDHIRNEHVGRGQEYEDLKDHIVLERLRNVEEQWHDAHVSC